MKNSLKWIISILSLSSVPAMILGSFIIVCSDSDSPSETVTFYGQPVPETGCVVFASDILTAEKHPHGSLAFSANGDDIYWSAFFADGPDQTIYHSTFIGESLSAPEVATFAGDFDNGGPAYSDDGLKVFFNSRRPFPDNPGDDVDCLWVVDRFISGWSDPGPIEAVYDSARTTGQVSVSRNGNLYFSGRRLDENLPKIYRSEYIAGEYSIPQQIDMDVPANVDLVDPYIDPDEQFILFASRFAGGGHGITDIYISRKQVDGSWGAPVNLGGTVNTADFERFPSLSRGGEYLFFVRNIGSPFPSEDCHFYWMKADFLSNL